MPRITLTLFAFALLAPLSASAQTVRRDCAAAQPDCLYEFGDGDVLGAGLLPQSALLRLRPGPVRAMLLRPRASFVMELLKSGDTL